MEPCSSDSRNLLCCAAERPVEHRSRSTCSTPVFTSLYMRPSLSNTLLVSLLVFGLCTPGIRGQAMDQTMVPRGQLRLQAHPIFTSWDRRFGLAPDGTERIEEVGDDLTSVNGISLFPGLPDLRSAIRDLGGLPTYNPTLGPTAGRVQQEMTSIEFGGEVGVFDWLTVGAVVPWNQTRTVIDVLHSPDTIGGDMGLNPIISDAAAVESFLSSATTARNASQADADAICATGPSLSCTNALDLAARAAAFASGISAAYEATPFFPLLGTAAGEGLIQTLTNLNADLQAANLSTLLPLVLSSETIAGEAFALLPTVPGTGIDATQALETRQGLWAVGDVEVAARMRLLDNLVTAQKTHEPGVGYRVTGTFVVRLPTGTPEDPDVLLDTGTGDAQLDIEGGLAADLRLGRWFGVSATGFYAQQRKTTLTRRVAAPGQVMAPVTTRREVRWTPGVLMGFDVAPHMRISSVLSVHAEYRYLHKFRDEVTLLVSDPAIDPVVLELESGLKLHQVGGGLRYDTVEPWLRGDGPRPMEVHLRFLHAISGSGGHAPKWTRVEAGIRLYRRFWGPTR